MPRLPHQRPDTGSLTTNQDVAAAAHALNAAHEELRQARRVLFEALDRRAALAGRQPAVCGSPAGFRRHQRAGEPSCDACVDAWTRDVTHRGHRARRAA